MYEAEWTSSWPTTAGRYWFWGYRFDQSTRKTMTLVEVVQGHDGPVYIGGGHFMYPSETGDGVWTVAIVPKAPEEEIEGIDG